MLAFVDNEERLLPVADVSVALGRRLPDACMDADSCRWLDHEVLAELRALDAERDSLQLVPLDRAGWRLGPPVARPGKIIAVGRNYLDHVREGQEIWARRGRKVEMPSFPAAFAKFPSSLVGAGDEIRIPEGIDDVDYEIELAVVIGRAAVAVGVDEALSCVAGYMICNDVAARGIQRKEMEAQIGITLAKNFPTFAPMGPWLTSADEIADPQRLALCLEVDGEARQTANTADMMFPVAELVAYWSRTGLEVGDILITGTPSGVALARDEPEQYYLRRGQEVVARIAGLGELRNPVV